MLDQLIAIAPLLSSAAIVTSATVALLVFVYTRRVNRRRATLDMVMRTFLDERGTKLYDEFKTLVRRSQDPADSFDLVDLVEHTPENEMRRNTVIDQLNNYELVSLGIRQGLFDEKFYKLWFHRQFTRDYGHVSGLIDAIRKKRPSAYCEFFALNALWQRKKHPVTQPSRLRMLWWVARNYKDLSASRIGMKS